MNFKTYDQRLEYLLALKRNIPVHLLNLSVPQRLYELLQIDLRKYFKIQVVGTNGKGSTCAFIESILHENGFNVGATYSPHLVKVTERIRVNRKDVDESRFVEICNKVKKTVEQAFSRGYFAYYPTFFEHITAMALLIFQEENVDFGALETGL
ncbi:MAG: hypothetical protein NZO16_03305 [Deltaproteobacteria bacterium]|nr:hypothetical protein [Deltaproteobacteria bacterium]